MPNTSDNNNDNDNDHNNAKQYDNNNNFAKRFRVWGLAQVHAPPQNRTWKVQRPPMVVGGGLEEDVCEVKDTAKQKRGWVPSRSLDSRRTGPAGSLYQAVQVMIYPWWSCQCRKGATMGPHCWIVLPMS
jgi:hypothetical protein